ncbi:unnamed protein product, partial [Polarella glacialis]
VFPRRSLSSEKEESLATVQTGSESVLDLFGLHSRAKALRLRRELSQVTLPESPRLLFPDGSHCYVFGRSPSLIRGPGPASTPTSEAAPPAAVGAPLQYLRGLRKQQSSRTKLLDQPLQVQSVAPSEQQTSGDAPAKHEQRPIQRHLLRLQLPSRGQTSKDEDGEAPKSALEILAAEVLPSSAWTSAQKRGPELHSARNASTSSRTGRSKSVSSLLSARLGEAASRNRKLLDSYRKPSSAAAPPPPLQLARLREQAVPGALPAPRLSARKGLESARSKSAASVASARTGALSSRERSLSARSPASGDSAKRDSSSGRRRRSHLAQPTQAQAPQAQEAPRQSGAVKNPPRIGRLQLQNIGAALPAGTGSAARLSQRRLQRQQIYSQRTTASSTRSLFRSPSAPQLLISARAAPERLLPVASGMMGRSKNDLVTATAMRTAALSFGLRGLTPSLPT